MSEVPVMNVLFVGGDRATLDRLEADAASSATRWRLLRAADVAEATGRITAAPPDAVVVQLAASGGDVPALSRLLRHSAPSTACVLIEGRRPAVHAAQAPSSLQMLACGSEPSAIAAGVARSLAVQRRIWTPAVTKVVHDIEELPSVPNTYLAITEAAQKPDTGLADIAKIVETDPAMSLKVLQLVNSAYFGISRRTSSIPQAVALLGLEQLRGLVLVSHVFSALESSEPKGFSIEAFQRYAVRVGRLAKAFMTDRRSGEQAFTAGLLHDVGKVVLALHDPAKFVKLIERMTEGEDACKVEVELFGVDHPSVGAHLLSTWEIPFPIVECVAFHHTPSKQAAPSPELAAVHAADALIGIVGCGEPETLLDTAFIERAGFAAQLPAWRKRVETECEES